MADMQRRYDYYCERNGLLLRSIGEVTGAEMELYFADEKAWYQALIANGEAQVMLSAEITASFKAAEARFGPDAARTISDVATADQMERGRRLAADHYRLSHGLGLAAIGGVNADGEEWIAIPSDTRT